MILLFFFFKQKTAYEMRTSDWSSDVCSSDLLFIGIGHQPNTKLFKDLLDMDETGYLITKPGSTYTNIEGVFAAGDVADKTYRQAVTAAEIGRASCRERVCQYV